MSAELKNGEMIVLKAEKKIYKWGEEEVKALDGVEHNTNRTEYISIIGQSIQGK